MRKRLKKKLKKRQMALEADSDVKLFEDFVERFISNMVDTPPEFLREINERPWDFVRNDF